MIILFFGLDARTQRSWLHWSTALKSVIEKDWCRKFSFVHVKLKYVWVSNRRSVYNKRSIFKKKLTKNACSLNLGRYNFSEYLIKGVLEIKMSRLDFSPKEWLFDLSIWYTQEIKSVNLCFMESKGKHWVSCGGPKSAFTCRRNEGYAGSLTFIGAEIRNDEQSSSSILECCVRFALKKGGDYLFFSKLWIK